MRKMGGTGGGVRVHPKDENSMVVSGLWKALGQSQMGHFSSFKHKFMFSHLVWPPIPALKAVEWVSIPQINPDRILVSERVQ